MRQRAVRLPSAVALVLLTLVALLNLSRPPGLSRRAAPRLEALVVGSTSRQAYLDVAELFIGRHLRMHVFTEANAARCVVCPDRDAWRSPPYETFGQDLDVHIWADRPDGWWCAQARPSAALAAFLAQRRGELPQFLLVMDDDTWVHLGRLRALLDEVDAAHPRAEPLYLGFTGHQFRDGPEAPPFCYGGAGYECSGHGICLDDGGCSCELGWVGLACNAECPGMQIASGSVSQSQTGVRWLCCRSRLCLTRSSPTVVCRSWRRSARLPTGLALPG